MSLGLGCPKTIAESIRELYQLGFLTLRHKSQFGWVIIVLHVSIEINRSQETIDTNCLLMILRNSKKQAFLRLPPVLERLAP